MYKDLWIAIAEIHDSAESMQRDHVDRLEHIKRAAKDARRLLGKIEIGDMTEPDMMDEVFGGVSHG